MRTLNLGIGQIEQNLRNLPAFDSRFPRQPILPQPSQPTITATHDSNALSRGPRPIVDSMIGLATVQMNRRTSLTPEGGKNYSALPVLARNRVLIADIPAGDAQLAVEQHSSLNAPNTAHSSANLRLFLHVCVC